MKYCQEGEIDIQVYFDGVVNSNKYAIGFNIILNRNPNFRDEPLHLLLT